MLKHTPGPWKLLSEDSQDRSFDVISSCPTAWDIAKVHGFCGFRRGNENYSETNANARLIAAAPDLLAALIEARSELEQYEAMISGEHYSSPTINDAISKATGEDS